MAAHQAGGAAGDEVVATLFLAAMSRPEAERTAFLDRACAGNAALRAEVGRRVNWECRMGGFLLTSLVDRDRIDRPFAPGDTVLHGRFRIVRVAGEGGMGVVYEAWDEKLARRVALKCARFEFRRRMPPEAAKSMCVTHPNACRVFDIHTEQTESGAVDFLNMEFLEGETLAANLANAPPGWLYTSEGAEAARQICDGLDAIHANGIVHRDLKSSNVMLARAVDGACRAVIMDFGISQAGDVFSSNARGTPAYVAPELWKGEAAAVRSDIYALGVLLFEMASGRLPFADGYDWKLRLEDPPPLGEFRQPLRGVLEKCLDPDPARRFGSVEEVRSRMAGRTRRWWVAGGGAAAACSIATAVGWDRWFPGSDLRLAILPVTPAANDPAAALVSGFLHDLSYRLQRLRPPRRKLAVHAVSQAGSEGVKTPAEARRMFGATHALTGRFQNGNLAAELVETDSGAVLREWRSQADPARLLSLQAAILDDVVRQFRLHTDPVRQSLPAAAYQDYLQAIHYTRLDLANVLRAIPLFEKAAAAAPNSPLPYAGLAEALLTAYHNEQNPSFHGKALTALAKAEQLDPELPQVHLMYGRLNAGGGLYERSRADFQRAAQLNPFDAGAYTGLGYALAYLGRYPEAESVFAQAIAAQPDYYGPREAAGLFYYELRRFDAAERQWLEAARLNPANARTWTNLGILCFDTGRDAEAGKYAQHSLQLRRTRAAIELTGDLHHRSGRYAEAVAAYEDAIRTGPPNYKTWASLALACQRAGRAADARRALRTGLADALRGVPVNPREPERLAWCAYYHALLGETPAALLRAGEAMALSATPLSRVRKRLVLAYDAAGDRTTAAQLIAEAPDYLRKELAGMEQLSAALRSDPGVARWRE